MKFNKFTMAFFLLPAIFLSIWFAMPSQEARPSPGETAAVSHNPVAVSAGTGNMVQSNQFRLNSSTSSPFGIASALPGQAEIILERRKRMLKDGYVTDEKYDSMSLEQLTRLSEIGDYNALVQMSERYSSEWESLQYADGVVDTVKPEEFAQTLMLRAVTQRGNALIPLQVARSLRQGNTVDAYAWDALAKYLNASPGTYYQRESAFNNMSDADRIAAEKKFRALSIELGVAEPDEVPNPQ